MKPKRGCTSISLLALFVPLTVFSASHPCAEEPEAVARLACYDKAYPLSSQVQAAAREQFKQRFGMDTGNNSSVSSANGKSVESVDRIADTVAAVTYADAGVRSFQLENGHVWTQSDARSGGHVRPGDPVEIRKTVFGGYALVLPNGVTFRVKRTR